MIPWKNCALDITEADLYRVEIRFGFRFPPEVREHYLKFNGGYPDRDTLVVGDIVYTVDGLFPIIYGKRLGTVDGLIQAFKQEQQFIPEHLVAFSADPCGNFYCFSIRSQDAGSVFWVSMDSVDAPVRLLAPSFRSFLNCLKRRDELAGH